MKWTLMFALILFTGCDECELEEGCEESGLSSFSSDSAVIDPAAIETFKGKSSQANESSLQQMEYILLQSQGWSFMSSYYVEETTETTESETTTSAEEEELSCADIERKNSQSILAEGQVMMISYNYQISTGCSEEMKAANERYIDTLDQGSSYVQCSNDVSSLSGLAYDEFSESVLETCGEILGVATHYNWQSEYLSSSTSGEYTTSTGEYLYAAEDGSVCNWSKNGDLYSLVDTCFSGYFSTYEYISADSSVISSRYDHEISTGLVATEGPYKWYSQGSIAFQMNDWTGTVTYQALDQAPTFEASNGTDSLSGQIGENSVVYMGLVRENHFENKKRSVSRKLFFKP